MLEEEVIRIPKYVLVDILIIEYSEVQQNKFVDFKLYSFVHL